MKEETLESKEQPWILQKPGNRDTLKILFLRLMLKSVLPLEIGQDGTVERP